MDSNQDERIEYDEFAVSTTLFIYYRGLRLFFFYVAAIALYTFGPSA
jgi:hypothetical protein